MWSFFSAFVGSPKEKDGPIRPLIRTGRPGALPAGPTRFTFCQHPHCSQGAMDLWEAAHQAGYRLGLDLTLAPTMTACAGTCQIGPFVGIPERRLFYHRVQPKQMATIFTETSILNRLVFPHLYLWSTRVWDSRIIFHWRQEFLVAMEADYCLVALTKYLFEFNAAESCGKCFPCRFGVHRVDYLLRIIMAGKAGPADVEELDMLTGIMATSGYCRFTDRVTAPVRLGLRFQRAAFERHLSCGCPVHERFLS